MCSLHTAFGLRIHTPSYEKTPFQHKTFYYCRNVTLCKSDPSPYDLKSLCAASEKGLYDIAPCVRKRPLKIL